MNITIDDEGLTARVALVGRLDIQGAEAVALPLATLAGGKKNAIIDLSGVSFLASIGIRHLVSAAKALSRRGGQLVLFAPAPAVLDVLATAGITAMIPTVATEGEARARVGA